MRVGVATSVEIVGEFERRETRDLEVYTKGVNHICPPTRDLLKGKKRASKPNQGVTCRPGKGEKKTERPAL